MQKGFPLTAREIKLARLGKLKIEGRVYDRLYEYYLNSGEMPYGVAKARDSDPYTWIEQKIAKEFGNAVQ